MQIFNAWILWRPLKPASFARQRIILSCFMPCVATVKLKFETSSTLSIRVNSFFFYFSFSLSLVSLKHIFAKTAETMMIYGLDSHSSYHLHEISERSNPMSMLRLSWFGTHFMVRKRTPSILYWAQCLYLFSSETFDTSDSKQCIRARRHNETDIAQMITLMNETKHEKFHTTDCRKKWKKNYKMKPLSGVCKGMQIPFFRY